MGGWRIAPLRSVIGLAMVALLCGVSADASVAAEPLPVTSASPVNGATFTAFPSPHASVVTSSDVPFEVTTPITGLYGGEVHVASQNVIGTNGILLHEFSVWSALL